jgi:lipoyl(octanoyl) transferase
MLGPAAAFARAMCDPRGWRSSLAHRAQSCLHNWQEWRSRGVSVYHNDRGGDITYHGPGQLVGYPILDLNHYYLDLHRYLRDIEQVIILTLAYYGVTATRDVDYTGVWVGTDKICAIGVKTSRWVTMHGFALNINTDLSHFGRIIPCGIFEKGVTSLKHLVGREVDLNEVGERVAIEFGRVFHSEIGQRSLQELEAAILVEKIA